MTSWEDLVQNLVRCGILKSPSVVRAMKIVPRRLFLPDIKEACAAIDSPLPIEDGQTVSAPHG